MDKLVIIDGNSLINRAFYALPLLSNKDGEYSNAVYGFTTMLLKMISEANPSHIVVAFDYGKKTFRNKLFADYKGTRKPTPPELKSQFPILKRLLEAMGIKYIEQEGIEADDIIGTIANKLNVQKIILTGDKDSLQLINDTTEVWLTKKGITDTVVMNTKTFFDTYGLEPKRLIDLKALMGDSSDNIPGVKGVGEKTALDLLHKYGSCEGVFEHLDDQKGKLKEKLEGSYDIAMLSKRLATIEVNADIDVNIDEYTYEFPFSEKVFEIFNQYNFNSLIKRDDIFVSGTNKIKTKKELHKNEIKTLDELDKALIGARVQKVIAFEIDKTFNFTVDGVTENFCVLEKNLLGDGLDLEDVLSHVKPYFEDENIYKICNDRKTILRKYGKYFSLNGKVFDDLLAYYITSGGEKVTIQDMLLSNNQDSEYIACSNFELEKKFKQALKDNEQERLYYEVELPLEMTLFDMEKTGFRIDRKVLFELKDKYGKEIADLQKIIYDLAGYEFNIQSPKQVAKLLFEDLGLKHKGKKGSTSVEVLEEIFDQHPIVAMIMRYRKLQKLVSTYIDPFEVMTRDEDIIHTEFKQMLTSTGRLSSIEPNLQNIPTRTEEGKALRKMFVPSSEDRYIISADYSQIELRLLAHFCGDENLINAYRTGQDIHMQTASEVFGVPFADVTPQMRRDAKAVNFGIVYGISEYGLAENIGCPVYIAKQYIETYFERFPGVKKYTDGNIAFAKEHGYVKTLLNRRRRIPDINSSNYNMRKFSERASMNMPLQGTASDIIKLAMVEVDRRLKGQNLKSKLILQIHDELIVDTAPDEINAIVNLLKDAMENVIKLNVPLVVDVNMGKDWFECK